MAKRIRQVDILKEIRRALRALHRAEKSITSKERIERVNAARARERAELAQLAEQTRGDFAADAERQREQRTVESFRRGLQ